VDLCERCPSADKTLISWETGEHCLYSFAEERDITVAEWFASRLGLPNRR
jgi:hypothetical protein